MTENELDRWATLVVAEARGQALSPAARAERRQIEREQPELLAEASLWAEFAELEQPRPGERDDASMIADVLARAPRDASDEPPKPRSRRVLAPVLGVVALAACVALALAIGQLREHGSQAIDRGRAQSLGGAAMALDEQPELLVATPGQHHLRDDDCRRAGASARLCTREQVRFRVADSSTRRHVELELDEGLLRIDSAAEQTLVEVHTAAGIVRALGIVELRFDPSTGELAIEVIEGEAELLGVEPTPVRLGVGATLSLIADTRTPSEPPPPEPTAVAPVLLPSVPSSPSSSSPAKPPPSADELLAAAQQALAGGESATAIERYDRLIRTYPESRAARTASVSLGRLLLRADQAEQALDAFDRYLESGATELLEEARYGRIRALRELGRGPEASAAIDEFLRAHPGSIHRERLESWRAQ